MRTAWTVIGLVTMLSGPQLQAQSAPVPPAPPTPPVAVAAPAAPAPPSASERVTSGDADAVRGALNDLLGEQPPAVRSVLRASPSLAVNQEFLQPYPQLAAFLASHPEIHRNPGYYFGTAANRDEPADVQRVRLLSDMVGGFGQFAALMALLGSVLWFCRSLLDHQRWKRALRVQAEAHAKIVERLSSTEDVLAYAQTTAGRQFLESGAPLESTRPGLAAPVGRILWSVQVGTVIATLGLGIFVCARMVSNSAELAEVAAFFRLVGTLGLAIGIGFLVSAALAYVLSQRLRLLPGSPGDAAARS